MPDDSVLAGILKWAALALALASALWGLLAPKPNREEIDGRQRFTTSGIVTLAIILGGVVVAGLSLWVETAIQQKNDAEAARAQADAKRLQALRDRLQIATASRARVAAANTGKSLAEIGAARAEGRAEAASARVEALARETRERLRDIELAQKVATGTRDNLARTGEALTQIERVLMPLETLKIYVQWEVPGDAPGMNAATARMAAQAERNKTRLRPWLYKPEEELYPGDTPAESNLHHLLLNANLVMAVFSATEQERKIELANRTGSLYSVADVYMSLSFKADKVRIIEYDAQSRSVKFSMAGEFAPKDVRKTTAIVSTRDLEAGRIVLTFEGPREHWWRSSGNGINTPRREHPGAEALQAWVRPTSIRFGSGVRMYEVPVNLVRRIERSGRTTFFLFPRLADLKLAPTYLSSGR